MTQAKQGSNKTTENSERLDWRARDGFEPAPPVYQLWEHKVTTTGSGKIYWIHKNFGLSDYVCCTFWDLMNLIWLFMDWFLSFGDYLYVTQIFGGSNSITNARNYMNQSLVKPWHKILLNRSCCISLNKWRCYALVFTICFALQLY